jgi:hypothetical protein
MNKNKIENVIMLSLEDRYSYFVQKVTDFEEVWGIYHDNGWAVMSDNNSNMVIPFWPEEEFALLCCTEQWEGYVPKAISLNDFMNKWLPGMEKDHRMVNVFLTADEKQGVIIRPLELLKDLKEGLDYP